MTAKKRTGQIFFAALLSLCAITVMAQPELRQTLFAQADEALKAANEARANVLAPRSYSAAVDEYRSAEEKLRRGGSIESIKENLDNAARSLREAVGATRLAAVTLTSAIQARDDADASSAASYASQQWLEAEEKFASAAMRLEAGNVKAARSRAGDAERLYRAAELAAIKANYLDETTRLIEQARKERVVRYAPRTLAKAESLLLQAETALEQNRYDTDEARTLAHQAKYEIQHAMHLARVLKPVRDRDVSLEDFALQGEAPMERIAASLDFVAEFDLGVTAPTDSIISRITMLQEDAVQLSERRTEILELETEIRRLETQLGTQSDRLAQQAKQRELFRQIETMFGPQEAQVLVQGGNILIRPVGLVFDPASSQLKTEHYALLRKVQDAIRVFPDRIIVVEGHTDSFGGDEINLRLSQSRADAVREYPLANMRDMSIGNIEAVGFGESRPVANNETVPGRAKNRRIDVVIRRDGTRIADVY